MTRMMRSAVRCLALIVSAATLSMHAANAAQVSFTSDSATTITLVGEIVDGDAAALKSALDRAAARGTAVTEIRLNSIGGSLHEGVDIVRVVYAAHLNTAVARGATCASACFLAFAAGTGKRADRLARVGVHVASIEVGNESPASIAGTAAMARIAQRLDVPCMIIDSMISTPANTMFWLSRSDLESMGVVIGDDS